MVASVMLTSCKQEDEGGPQEEDRKANSIVMAIVSEAPVSAETEKKVEEAFNAITKAKYKTQVDIRYYTPEEYYDKVTALLEASINDDPTAGVTPETNENGEVVGEEETVMNDKYNYAEVVYPEIRENQLDIVFIQNADMYKTYVDNGHLARLEDHLTGESKLLSDFIHSGFITSAKYSEGTYAIPNNVVTTDYTYLLLNKELSTKYQYTEAAKKWTSVVDAEAFIKDIANFETGVAPVFGNVVPTNIHNWSYEVSQLGSPTVNEDGEEVTITTFTMKPSSFSIFGCGLPAEGGNEAVLSCAENLLASSTYTKQLLKIQELKENNYIKTELKDGEKFAVGFIKGNEGDIEKYREEYDIVITEYPRLTQSELFAGMFGVSEHSKNTVTRCMEIITHLNTQSDLRNILQYGVENVHYTIDDKTGILTRLNNDYMMDVKKTGNIFVAHAEEGVDPATVKYAIAQNRDAVIYPGISFTGNSTNNVFAEYVEKANELSEKYEDKLNACKTVAEIQAVITEYAADEEADKLFMKWNALEPSDENYSPYAAYYNWALEMGYIVAEEG